MVQDVQTVQIDLPKSCFIELGLNVEFILKCIEHFYKMQKRQIVFFFIK